MLLRAAKEYNIDLNQSWMIGDSEIDVEAGIAAGCKVVKLGEGEKYSDLLCCVKDILPPLRD